MAGVYINGMEMPPSCRKCGLKMDCDHCESWECYCLPLQKNIGYMDDEPEIPSDKRRDDCPLIPVPYHGRCVDADKLNEYLKTEAARCDGEEKYAYNDARAELNTMPTIPPAEDERLFDSLKRGLEQAIKGECRSEIITAEKVTE